MTYRNYLSLGKIFASSSGNKKEPRRSSQVSIIRYINYLPQLRSFMCKLHWRRIAYHRPLLPIPYDNFWSRSMGSSFHPLSLNLSLDLYKCGTTNSAVWCCGMVDNDMIREPPQWITKRTRRPYTSFSCCQQMLQLGKHLKNQRQN